MGKFLTGFLGQYTKEYSTGLAEIPLLVKYPTLRVQIGRGNLPFFPDPFETTLDQFLRKRKVFTCIGQAVSEIVAQRWILGFERMCSPEGF